MNGVGKFIGGGVYAILGIVGLLISARAHDGPIALFGLLLFGFTVLMLFRLIAISFDVKESA